MALTSRKVLVAEDDESMREAIEHLLGAAGVESRTYASAEALLASGECESAACVVSDLKLTEMSGLDLLARLRARGLAMPLILITAHDRPGLRQEAIRSGAAAYLAKPFRGAALLGIIRSLVDPETQDHDT